MKTTTWIIIGGAGAAAALLFYQQRRLAAAQAELEAQRAEAELEAAQVLEEAGMVPSDEGYEDEFAVLAEALAAQAAAASAAWKTTPTTPTTVSPEQAAANEWYSKMDKLGLSPCDTSAHGLPEPWRKRLAMCNGSVACEDKVFRSFWQYWPQDELCRSFLKCAGDRVCAQKAYDRIVGTTTTTTASTNHTRDIGQMTARGSRYIGGW